ncbi:MAG TPA: hypothetical protein VJV22_09595 [Acidobacteriaceae bacterium]|nr:hypothetical protein [Acidobacteriaceae bacterium]
MISATSETAISRARRVGDNTQVLASLSVRESASSSARGSLHRAGKDVTSAMVPPCVWPVLFSEVLPVSEGNKESNESELIPPITLQHWLLLAYAVNQKVEADPASADEATYPNVTISVPCSCCAVYPSGNTDKAIYFPDDPRVPLLYSEQST